MKIGIITFHCAINYGAVLQTYATQEQLKKMGHEVEVIDYRPTFVTDLCRIFPALGKMEFLPAVKLMMSAFISFGRRVKKLRTFRNFINTRLHLSQNSYLTPFEKNDNYDAYVFGSDQIWNFTITRGFDPVLWGDFLARPKARKIAYAASMALNSLKPLEEDIVRQKLLNFDAVGVREKHLENLLQPLTDKKVETVLDPTLLVDPEVWKELAQKEPTRKKRYVLAYLIGVDDQKLKFAGKIAERLGCNLVAIGASTWPRPGLFQSVSPEGFVSLFSHSDFVVTDSFHGTAFALTFNRPFYSLGSGRIKDCRQESLLERLALADRLASTSFGLPDDIRVDFEIANQRLNRLRGLSRKFLSEALDAG